jgi:hypothetical protein
MSDVRRDCRLLHAGQSVPLWADMRMPDINKSSTQKRDYMV